MRAFDRPAGCESPLPQMLHISAALVSCIFRDRPANEMLVEKKSDVDGNRTWRGRPSDVIKETRTSSDLSRYEFVYIYLWGKFYNPIQLFNILYQRVEISINQLVSAHRIMAPSYILWKHVGAKLPTWSSADRVNQGIQENAWLKIYLKLWSGRIKSEVMKHWCWWQIITYVACNDCSTMYDAILSL